MSNEKKPVARGRCLCGGVSFEVTSEIPDVTYCHCKQCRIWHGNVVGYTGCRTEDLTFTSDKTLKWFSSSEKAIRGFCTECGSSLFWKEKETPFISFTAGCLDEPTGLTSKSHIFVASAGDYYEIDDTLQKFDGDHTELV